MNAKTRWWLSALTAALGCMAAEAPGGGDPPPVTPPGSPVVLVGAGDIASCSSQGDEATARLLDNAVSGPLPVIVFTTGDNAYQDGSVDEYATCYDPTWGRHKARTRPAAGNHDYNGSTAPGYFGYFGAAAGPPPPGGGYYSFDAGDWHVIVLNSNIAMAAGSEQERWLRADLAASSAQCTLAIWHHPRFTSGKKHGNITAAGPLWDALYEAGADVVINGHEHSYERLAPQTPAGVADPARGLREFVVGTGGSDLSSFGTPLPTSEARNAAVFGVLQLTLRTGTYSWEFVPVAGASFTDSGTGSCH
jgi:hypothetical protein